MNYDRLIKLEKLIKESPILTAQEREEWLALLDLMNDKQLSELDKILQVQSKPAEEVKPEMKPAVPVLLPKKSEVKPSPTLAEVLAKNSELKKDSNLPKPTGPKLGHLMNLPTGFSSGAVTPSSLLKNLQHTAPLKQPTVGLTEKKLDNNKGTFWKKIKDILAEKELKSGRESIITEKELPAGAVILSTRPNIPEKTQVPASQNVKSDGSALGSKVEQKTPVAKITFKPLVPPQMSKKPSFNIPVPKPKASPQPVSLRLILKQGELPKQQIPVVPLTIQSAPVVVPKTEVKKQEVVKYGPTDRNDRVSTTLNEREVRDSGYLESLRHPVVAKAEEKKLATGVKLDEVNANANSSKFFGSLKGLRPEDKAKIPPRSFEKLKLLAPQDLKKLTPENFVYEDQASLMKSVREFIHSFGYHEVIFALEQSPLFKSYIETGAKILSGQGQFSEETSEGSTSELLKQEDFEKIADLLMEIQTG